MPIVVSKKDIKWRETDEKIILIVPLLSRIGSKPSVLSTRKYLKVCSPPYIFECFLFDCIDVDASTVRVETNKVTFDLRKDKPGLWNSLTNIDAENEEYCKMERNNAFLENKEYLENMSKDKTKRKKDIQTTSVRKQLEIDDLIKKQIEEEKNLEKEKLILELRRKKAQDRAKMISEKRKQLQELSETMPPTRINGHITVTFSDRVFPSAARESQEAEENEWLKKQAAAKKNIDIGLSDLLPEQQNPEWLEKKAKSMLEKEDYQSATNVYDLAIKMCPLLYSLYLGRSFCHYKLKNLHKALEDSSKALELLVPFTALNTEARKKAHETRGLSFKELNLYKEALVELNAAVKLDPGDQVLAAEVEKIKVLT